LEGKQGRAIIKIQNTYLAGRIGLAESSLLYLCPHHNKETINNQIANFLRKLLIKQIKTKDRYHHNNTLAETKKGIVIKKIWAGRISISHSAE